MKFDLVLLFFWLFVNAIEQSMSRFNFQAVDFYVVIIYVDL